MLLSISEIVAKAGALSTDEEKVAFLKANGSQPFRQVLKYTYDPDIEFLLPSSPPPWKKNSYVGVEGMLYKEVRRLRIFIKGGGYDNLAKTKREQLFISLLEDIDNRDAELLCLMIAKKEFPGLSVTVVQQAFPEDYKKV